MSRLCYFVLLVTLFFQDFTFLCAFSPAPGPATPDAPASTPTYVPANTPANVPAYTPANVPAYTPTPSSPSPSHDNNGGTPPTLPSAPSVSPPPQQSAKTKGSSKRMSGGQKAGIAFGVIAGAALLGFGGMVYAKRRHNIRRSRNISSVQLGAAFVRRPSP